MFMELNYQIRESYYHLDNNCSKLYTININPSSPTINYKHNNIEDNEVEVKCFLELVIKDSIV